MRIAVLSTVYKTTPPTGYGGIERVVYTLAEELLRQGHDVTLFGSKDSYCSGRTVAIEACNPEKSRSGIHKKSDILSEEPLYEAVSAFLKENPIDVIHDFSFQNLFVLRHPEKCPFVISTCIPPSPAYHRPNLVACSRAHAELCGGATKFVHYGLDLSYWPFSPTPEEHFIHISKIARYKGQHLAVLAARKTRMELHLAGNIEDPFYFYTMIKPWLMISPNIRHIGEIAGTDQHLKKARALIQTPRWFDAFPLVILESLATGTPVIAFPEGGVPEQIVDGVTGFICHDVDELAAAMRKIGRIKREDCRAYAEKHFSVKRMADDYTDLYHQVMNGRNW